MLLHVYHTVSTTICVDHHSLHYLICYYIICYYIITCVLYSFHHHVFMVSFLSKMNYLPTLVGLFLKWKKLTNKTCWTIYFTNQKSQCECFIKRPINVPDQRVLILLSMILLSKKLFQKIFYIALTNTCVNKDF